MSEGQHCKKADNLKRPEGLFRKGCDHQPDQFRILRASAKMPKM